MVITTVLILICFISAICVQAADHATYGICEENKAICFGDKDNCHKTKDCGYMVAIKKVSNGYQFNLLYKDAPQENYVAVGLATDGKDMKDTAIVSCQKKPPAPTNVQPYFSPIKGTSNIKMVDPPSIMIVSGGDVKFNWANSVMDCEFVLNPSFTIPSSSMSFNLDTKDYKILLAVGVYDENSIKSPTIKLKFHGSFRRSTQRFRLDGTEIKEKNDTTKHSFSTITLLFAYIITKFLN